MRLGEADHAKKMIDGTPFARFNEIVNKAAANATTYGVTISETENTIDFKDIVIKDGKLSIHDEDIPFRLKGKGARRLIPMAIQTAIADAGGIILIDKVDQGLEPDRVQNFVNRTSSLTNKVRVYFLYQGIQLLLWSRAK